MASRLTKDGTVQSTQSVPVEEIMFGAYLERVFSENGEKVAIVDSETGTQYTFGELLEICKSIGAFLQQRGVKPNDIVVFCTKTSVRACCIILALVFCQATTVFTKHFYSVYEFREVLGKFSTLKLVIADDASSSKLEEASDVEVLNIDAMWELGQAASFKKPPESDPKSHVLLMALTSGSTGPSKAVCMSHYNMMGNLTQWDSGCPRLLMANPVSHLSGIFCFELALAKAETLYVASENLKDNLDDFLEVCFEHKIQTVLAMPVLFTRLTKFGSSDKFGSMKRVMTGGSTIPQPIINEFCSIYPQIDIEVVFGATEGGIILRSTDPNKLHHMEVLPNVEVKIVDLDTKAILGPNQSGMLHCKAPSIAVGYYNNKKATDETFVDGWLVSGDLAYRDDKDRIVIVDRLKQMIKCMDSQVVPADLELLLSEDDQVLNGLVAGVPHAEFGEAAVAFVVPRRRSNLAELRNRLVKNIEEKCAVYKHLHGGLYFVDSIPQTDSGKFSRKDMVRMHLNNQVSYLD